jgi:hypothetical protein
LQQSSVCGAFVLVGVLLCATACEDLREWKTARNEVFRGEVIGNDADPDVDSFIRKGFASHTLLELTFDPYSSDVAASDAGDAMPRTVVAGTIDTYRCPDGGSTCNADERIAGPIVKSPLITIDALTHDPLSQYTFPGGGRLRNYMFGVHFTSVRGEQITGRDAMVFVSLMENGQVEVRAMAPSILARDANSERWPALFGVFPLRRTALVR